MFDYFIVLTFLAVICFGVSVFALYKSGHGTHGGDRTNTWGSE